MTLWVALALGQASTAPDAALLKLVPADVDFVLRLRGLAATHDDALAMLKAMSPALEKQLEPMVEDMARSLSGQFGDKATEGPLLLMSRLAKPDAPLDDLPPLAVLLTSGDYKTIQRQIAGTNHKPETQKGGWDIIPGPNSEPIYTYKGSGYFAVSTDEAMIQSIVKPGRTLDSALSAEAKANLLGGDMGLYLNMPRMRARYREVFDQARQLLVGAPERAGEDDAPPIRVGLSTAAELFEALDKGATLVSHFEFGAEGLVINGQADAEVEAVEPAPSGKTTLLAKLPAASGFFEATRHTPDSFADWQARRNAFWNGRSAKPSEQVAEAQKRQRDAGVQETATCRAPGVGLWSLTLVAAGDPKLFVEATTDAFRASRPEGDVPKTAVHDVEVTESVAKHRGFALHKAEVTIDLPALARLHPEDPTLAPAVGEALAGENLITWYGTDGKLVVMVVARTLDAAKAQIDAAASGAGGLGEAAGFGSLREQLPAEAGTIVVASAQGLVRQVVGQVSGMLADPSIRVPAGLPRDPVFLGVALGHQGPARTFRVVVPGAVGPVVEKGVMPIVELLGAKSKK